jgi:TetR/AcrR family transcriptional repressor of nem operon
MPAVTLARKIPAPAAALANQPAPARPDTRQRLIHEARLLFWVGSYSSVSVDDICRAAGVRKGSFYHFFESKESLVLELFEQHWQQKEPLLRESFDGARYTAREMLDRMYNNIVNWQEEEYEATGRIVGAHWYSIGQEMCAHNAQIAAKTQQTFQRYRNYHAVMLEKAKAEGLLSPATDATALAEVMWASIMGVLGQAKIKNDITLIRTLLPEVMARFLTTPQPALVPHVDPRLKTSATFRKVRQAWQMLTRQP